MASEPTEGGTRLDMSVLRQLTFEPVTYEVSREKIREYAIAIGDDNPLHRDSAAARAQGYPDIIAPPSFQAAVTSLPWRNATGNAEWVRRSTIDVGKLLHGEQSFELFGPIFPGASLTVTSKVVSVQDKARFVLLQVTTTVRESDDRTIIEALASYVLMR